MSEYYVCGHCGVTLEVDLKGEVIHCVSHPNGLIEVRYYDG